jgi:transcriptional regulator with XRE-family HTH domain
VGSIGRYTHEDELTCVACVAKDRTAQFGTRMRALRLAAGLSVRELAAEIGMKAATLRYWEFAGKFPRADLVQRVGHVLGVDPRVLLNGESK